MFHASKRRNRFIANPIILGTYVKIKRPFNKQRLFLKISLSLFVLWLLFYSPLFKINAQKTSLPETKIISPNDLQALIRGQLTARRWLILPQSNLWLLSKKQLMTEINNQYAVQDLKIIKRLPGKLRLEFKEKTYQLAWQEGGKYYYLNEQGEVILQNSFKPADLLILDNLGSSKIIVPAAGQRQYINNINISPAYLQAILQLNQILKNNLPELLIEQYIVDDQPETVKFKARNGPLMYFATNEDYQAQIVKLKTLRQEILVSNLDFNNKLYIDLRFGDKIFYQ